MLYVAISIISLALAAAMSALYLRGRVEYLQARDDLFRSNEEKDILIEFLHRSSEYVSQGADSEKLYNLIVRATALSCGAMSACVYEKSEDGTLHAKAVEGLFPPMNTEVGRPGRNDSRVKFLENVIGRETIEANEGIIGAVANDGTGVLIEDASADPRVKKHADEALAIHSLMAVPVKFRGRIHGVLAVANPISGKPFTQTDFSLATSIGEQAGVAVHSSEAISALLQKGKLDFDLRLASSVQRYILPQSLPGNADLEFAVKYIPQQLIGGDFYDCFRLPDGACGVAIGDVSGKGISAAILMALCKTQLRNIALKGNAPSETLKELNAEMVNTMRSDMFITLVYAVISKDNSKITLARAGHELPLLYSAKNAGAPADEISSPGMAVGMVGPEIFDAAIGDVSVNFERGDVFVLYTDGLTEAANAEGAEYSGERLRQAVANLHLHGADEINLGIQKSVENFAGARGLRDDFTLFTIKRI